MTRKIKTPNKKPHLTVSKSISYKSSPIPNAEELKKYEEVLSGSADRIIKLAEKEQEHRHYIEKIESERFTKATMVYTKGSLFAEYLGSVIGGIILLSIIFGAIYLLSIGRNIEGYVSLIVACGGLFSSLKIRNKEKNK